MAAPTSKLLIDLKDATAKPKTISLIVPSKSLVGASWICTYSQTGIAPDYTFKAYLKWSGAQPVASPPTFSLLSGTTALAGPTSPSPFPSSGASELTKIWSASSYGYAGTFKLEIAFTFEPLDEVDPNAPHDVRIDFTGGRELWANSTILSSASPYFKGLLESGFAESSLTVSQSTGSTSTTPTLVEGDSEPTWDGTEDDSDDETDTLVGKSESSKSAQKGSYHSVKSPASFTTYRAVLVYLLSHHITFAPLLSTYRASTYPAATEAASSRHQAIRVLLSKSPNLPAPASPKSVYRLAHLLQLPKLETLALTEIQRQLSVENAAYELYGSVASVYDAIREVVLDFCVENWTAVRESSAMKEMEQLAEAGELSPKVVATAMQLAKRLNK